MPTYPVKHKETGETQELYMSMKDYEQWKIDNPDWDKDWSKGVAGVGEAGDWRNKMNKTHPGWGEIMTRASKLPGSNVQW
jgi:hypothetical protein